MVGVLRQNRIPVQPKLFNLSQNMIQHAAMLDHRSFRLAGRTGCVDDVSESCSIHLYEKIIPGMLRD
ncbi:hypothetical protein D3C78_1996380 [compost metagenome]